MMTKQIRLITFFRLIFVLRLIYETGDQIKLGALALDQSYPGVPGERFLGPIVRVVGRWVSSSVSGNAGIDQSCVME